MGSVATVTRPAGMGAAVRYRELDSLRGVAALTVIFYHFRLMWFGYGRGPKWWLTLFSPVTAGHEAVMLFFLLSGFVLSIPCLRGKGQGYAVYLTRRVLRIYGPYLFALMLAVSCAAIWHGALPGGEWSKMTWGEPVRWRLVLEHVVMIGSYDDSQYNTAFWSLVTEMRISIVFPLLFWAVNRMRASVAVGGATAGTVVTVLVLGHTEGMGFLISVQYGMIFVYGIVLAKNLHRANAWYCGLRGWMRVLLGVASFLLYTWGYRIAQYAHHPAGLDQVLIALGAAGYMLGAMNAEWAKRLLGTKPAVFLGRISYSLYLVHGTVLFALAHALGARVPVGVQLILFVGLSVGLSFLFCVGVEEQFLRLSRVVGAKVPGAEMRSLRLREGKTFLGPRG